MARTGAASALTPADLRGPVSPARAAELDRTLKRPLTGNGAAIVKVYNDKGTVVYAGNHEQIGEREPDEVTEPLAREPSSTSWPAAPTTTARARGCSRCTCR